MNSLCIKTNNEDILKYLQNAKYILFSKRI